MRTQKHLPVLVHIPLLLMLCGAMAACSGAPAPAATAAPVTSAPTSAPAADATAGPAADLPTSGPATGAERVKVEMWLNMSNDLDIKAYQIGVDSFNKSQDKIELKLVPGQGNDAFPTASFEQQHHQP